MRLGKADAAKLKEAEDRLIREAVKLQEDLGLPSITDGEFRRDWWHIDFLAGFDGIELQREGDSYHGVQFKGVEATPPTMFVTRQAAAHQAEHGPAFPVSEIRREERNAEIHHALAGHAARARRPRIDPQDAIPIAATSGPTSTQCYREEIADLYKAGCRYLQIDDTTIAMFGDPKVQEHSASSATTRRRTWRSTHEAVNDAIRDVPDDMTVAMHTCRGNFKSTWLASGSYDYVAETAFSTIDVDGFFLEFDDERSGGFEPLRYIPRGKRVVLGLVSLQGSGAGEQGCSQAAHRGRRPNSCRSKTCACRRNAASPARTTATT